MDPKELLVSVASFIWHNLIQENWFYFIGGTIVIMVAWKILKFSLKWVFRIAAILVVVLIIKSVLGV